MWSEKFFFWYMGDVSILASIIWFKIISLAFLDCVWWWGTGISMFFLLLKEKWKKWWFHDIHGGIMGGERNMGALSQGSRCAGRSAALPSLDFPIPGIGLPILGWGQIGMPICEGGQIGNPDFPSSPKSATRMSGPPPNRRPICPNRSNPTRFRAIAPFNTRIEATGKAPPPPPTIGPIQPIPP